jgi:cation diffusion facilitator CzcD-associated flavoprotein CzcO
MSEAERCAIVGSGLAALAAYATLRHGGVRSDEIAVFGTHADPCEVWLRRASGIRQQRMRSESDGHLAATSFPGLALREARRRRSLHPLIASVADRYHPAVDDFVAHAAQLRARCGWDASFRERRVGHVRSVAGGFTLDGSGPFAHVLLATGHPGLAVPPQLAGRGNVVHAYEPHEYASRIAIVGAGMAAATEWLNALRAGSEVVSLRRREPVRRPLNVPRPLFSKRGLAAFHRTPPPRRIAFLRELSTPSFPAGREWDEPIAAAGRDGRFRVITLAHDSNGAAAGGCEQVIAATGFRRGFHSDPLLADLVDAHGLETQDDWLVLGPDSTVPALTDGTRTLSVAGVAGQWAFPAADTIAGAKYAARAFLHRVCRTR